MSSFVSTKQHVEVCKRLEKEIESLRFQLNDERKHSDIILQQRDEAIGDLSQAKEDIESLRYQVEILTESYKLACRSRDIFLKRYQILRDNLSDEEFAELCELWSEPE